MIEYDSGVPALVQISVTVVFCVRLYVTTILIIQQGLKLHVWRFFSTQRLQLSQAILPVELSALLFPFVVGLHIFLFLIGVSDGPDLGNCMLAFTLGIFS